MSLANSANCSLRPQNRIFEMYGPLSADEGNSFDDFFNEEMYRPEASEEDNRIQFDEFEDLFHDPSNHDEYKLQSLDTSTTKTDNLSPQPWRKGIWCLKRQPQQPPKLMVEKTRRLETKRSEPVQTTSTHHLRHAQGPVSPLETTPPGRTKRFVTSPAAVMPFDPTTYVRPPFSRETTLSPSPMYAQLPISPRPGHADTSDWQQDFQNFHLRLPYDQPYQTQASPRRQTRQSHLARTANAVIVAQNQGVNNISVGYMDTYGGSNYAEASAIDPVLLSPQHETPREDRQTFKQELQAQLTAHAVSSMPSPISASLPSSNSSIHSQGGRTHTSNTNFSMHSSQPIFTPPMMATAHPPLPTLAPEETYPALAAPKPQRVPHPILHQPNSNSLTGLGIQYPELEQMSQAVLYEPRGYFPPAPTSIGVAVPYPPLPPTSMANNSMYPYPALPPPSSHVFSDQSPFATPRKQRKSPSRSLSPPVSPATISPRRNPRRSPNRVMTDYSQTRRKSIHKSGPIRDTGGQEYAPTPRARSSSRPPRTPRGPKTPSGGAAVVDFVNFTPRDASKLLNDVAPSGSSKTRARREQEAKDKRKKLSEAAKQAVMVAGGDVAAFERAIYI